MGPASLTHQPLASVQAFLKERHELLMVIQLALFGYLLAYFVVSLYHVYRASWLVTGGKAVGILLGYLVLVAVSFEAASHFRA